MTVEDFRLLVARISLAAPLGAVKAPQPKPVPERVVRLRKTAQTATVRPA